MLDLNAQGIKNTAALFGGWNGWKQAQLPTEASVKPAAAKPVAKPAPAKKGAK